MNGFGKSSPVKRIRCGFVGAGYVAGEHARAIRSLPFVELAGVTDLDTRTARTLGERFGIPVFASLSEMKAAAPDVIHVLTPPESHCEVTLAALEMNCHVLVEKPMAESVAECDSMIDAARRAGRVLSVNHSARFDKTVLEAAKLVRQGVLGKPIAVHFLRSSEYPPYAGGPLPAPFRQGSYPFRDIGVHGLYLIELFLGPVKDLRVRAYESGRDPLLTFDEWRAEMDCRDGTASMFLSWNARPVQNQLLIQGTDLALHLDCFLHTCELSRMMPGPSRIAMAVNGTRNAIKKSFQVPWNLLRPPLPAIDRSVHEFYRALLAGNPAPVLAEEGRNAIAWIESASVEMDAAKAERLRRQAAPLLQPSRILVTGGAGFLGSALVERLLVAGEPVRLLLRRPPRSGSPADPERSGGAISIVYGSLGQTDVVDAAMQGIELVYHLGAATQGGPSEFEQATIWGTRNVIEACMKHGVKRLVYVSSLSVMDHVGHRTGDPVREDSPLEPFLMRRSLYTQSKFEAEKMVLQASKERGLAVVVLRPGKVFGPGAERSAPNGVINFAGWWIVAGSGSKKVPFVFLEDVVDGMMEAAVRPDAPGEIINLVDTTPLDQNEYIRHSRPSKLVRIPVLVLMTGAWMVELLGKILRRKPPVTRYNIRSLEPLYPFDVSQAERVLGWRPRVGTREGLLRTFGQQAQDARPDSEPRVKTEIDC
jgi:predicted dehydrogenase/nucleoside-diphosphate-sugar epimerase